MKPRCRPQDESSRWDVCPWSADGKPLPRADTDNECCVDIDSSAPGLVKYARHNPNEHTICIPKEPITLQDFGSIEFTGIHDPAQCSQKAEALAAQGVPTYGMVVNGPYETCCITTGIQRKVGIADCKPAADGPFNLEGVPDP